MEKETLNFYNFFTFMLSLIQKKIKPNNQKLNKHNRLLLFKNKNFTTDLIIYRNLFPYSSIYWESYLDNLYFSSKTPIFFTLESINDFLHISIINNQIYKCGRIKLSETNLKFSNITCYTSKNIINEIKKDQHEYIKAHENPYIKNMLLLKEYPYFIPLNKQEIQELFQPNDDYKKEILHNIDRISGVI